MEKMLEMDFESSTWNPILGRMENNIICIAFWIYCWLCYIHLISSSISQSFHSIRNSVSWNCLWFYIFQLILYKCYEDNIFLAFTFFFFLFVALLSFCVRSESRFHSLCFFSVVVSTYRMYQMENEIFS